MTMNYPHHFLHDIEAMTSEQQDARRDELIGWVKRYSTGGGNPKWVTFHLFELARLAKIMRDRA